MRAMILYEHCSPHQVTAVEAARLYFHENQHELVPVEFYYRSIDYGWTLGDKARSQAWHCLFSQQQRVSNYQLFRSVVSLVKSLKIDVLFINGWYGRYAWWLAWCKWYVGCKLVIVSDSVQWDAPRTWWKELPKRWLMRRMDAGFVAGQPQSQYLQSLGLSVDRISQGNDVVDNSLYASIPLRSSPVGRRVMIGTAARLIPKKNLSAAIRAFEEVVRKHPDLDIQWHIAGQGPLEVELKQLVAELELPVVFRGFVGYYDMPGFYSELDCYWQPSSSEPWGLVVNEAMASGLPALVSDRCGCAIDLVNQGTGWVHALTHEGVVNGLEKAISCREHWPAMGKNARDLIGQWDCHRFSRGLLEATRLAASAKR